MAIHPAHKPMPREATFDLEAEAERMLTRLSQGRRRGNLVAVELAYGLAETQLKGLYRPYGCSSAVEFAERFDLASASKARDLLALVADLEQKRLDEIRAAFEAGELRWTKARTMASVARADDQQAWLARKNLSNRKLEAEARAARGLAPTVRKTLDFEPEDWATIEAVTDARMKAARQKGQRLTRAQALARACVNGAAADDAKTDADGKPRAKRRLREQIVKYHCQTCQQASMETREGPVPVSPASLAASACEARCLDITGAPKKATRPIPLTIREHVLARARYRCEVEGCSNRDHLYIHHEGGWQRGHDPDLLHVYCWDHHQARHDELLGMQGTRATGITFTSPSGTPVASHVSASTPWPIVDAVAVLRGLEMRSREATALVERAVRALDQRGQAPDLQALIREALSQLPTPGARAASG